MQKSVVVAVQKNRGQALHLLLKRHGCQVATCRQRQMAWFTGKKLQHGRKGCITGLGKAIKAAPSLSCLADFVAIKEAVGKDLDNVFQHDEVIIATGVIPRGLKIEGADAPQVLSYAEVLRGAPVGNNVAVIGAGGIGFDVSEFLLKPEHQPQPQPLEDWKREWGVDQNPHYTTEGGFVPAEVEAPVRQIYLMQRKTTALGVGLGKTSGWVHRAQLKKHAVKMMRGVQYKAVTNEGLWVEMNGHDQLLRVDTIVVCAGQESVKDLMPAEGEKTLANYHIIGGAKLAAELDAKRAIREGAELAAKL